MTDRNDAAVSLEALIEELLPAIIEASQRRGDESFRLLEAREGDFLQHPGLPGGTLRTSGSAIRALQKRGLIQLRPGSSSNASWVDYIPPINVEHRTVRPPSKTPVHFETAFNAYSYVRVRGEGGCGRVFVVKDRDDKEFALKCLFPSAVNTDRRKRFKNEISFCSKTQHSNIIQVFESGVVEWDAKQCPFYVMPLYPMTLRNLIEKNLPPDEVLPLFSQILDGVEAAHLLRVFHRDLKAENILCDNARKHIVVADFGIAHFEEDILITSVETKDTARMANFCYSAPEQRMRGGAVDHRADIFALGLMLNEMFTGSIPQGVGYAKVGTVAPEFSYLDDIIEKMIQHNVEARPATIEEVKKELIGRHHQFVALQELDRKRGEVVTTSTPPLFDDIKLIDFDWNPRKHLLLLKLNRDPEPLWIQQFRDLPRSLYEAMMGASPEFFGFDIDKASIKLEARSVQTVVDHFKNYVAMANEQTRQVLAHQAKQKDAERREALERKVQGAEERAQLLASVKI